MSALSALSPSSVHSAVNPAVHRPHAAAVAAPGVAPPRGPAPALSSASASDWASTALGLVLEQLDHGITVLDAQGHLLHANRAALRSFGEQGMLCLRDGQLRARRPADADRLERALCDARRGLRSLLCFEEHPQPPSLPLLVMPLNAGRCEAGDMLTLVISGRCAGGDMLHVEMFARAHHLTSAECAVLKSLCLGHNPTELAQQHGVQVSTVRTQIGSVRQKTRTRSIRELVSLVQGLPPVVSLLARMG